jgi:3-deoxy-manno-octulosonate cytidylyltransferase (CMP-KDO synthetase)
MPNSLIDVKSKNNKILAIIPARMDSSRFPGKPMAKILGVPMIGHVFRRVATNPLLSMTAVATCDKEIADYIESIGGRAIMTDNKHERASDRCAEALEIIESEDGNCFEIIVMVQGDEPMTHPDMITEAVQPMIENSQINIVNLMGDIVSLREFNDPNCIKVVCDKSNNAIYFSREPIPTMKMIKEIPMKKQVCIIPFRCNFLKEYSSMTQTPLEISESIDMLRILENGLKVKMVPTIFSTTAVDTHNDLLKVEELMLNQDYAKYL